MWVDNQPIERGMKVQRQEKMGLWKMFAFDRLLQFAPSSFTYSVLRAISLPSPSCLRSIVTLPPDPRLLKRNNDRRREARPAARRT
jgi:hypothetical protein